MTSAVETNLCEPFNDSLKISKDVDEVAPVINDTKDSKKTTNAWKSGAFHPIPRKHSGGESEGNRKQRKSSESGSGKKRNNRRRSPSEASNVQESAEPSPMKQLRETITEKHDKKALNLLNSYIKTKMDLAKFENCVSFLQRCYATKVLPKQYRLQNSNIKNTKAIHRIIERHSIMIFNADMKYNLKRQTQVNKLLPEKINRMKEMFSEELVEEILKVTQEAFERRSERFKNQQTKIFETLIKEYKLSEDDVKDGEGRLIQLKERAVEREQRRQAEREQRATEKKETKTENKDEEDAGSDKDDE